MTRKELEAENEQLRRQVVDLHAEVMALRAQQLSWTPPTQWPWPGSGIVVGDVPPYQGPSPYMGDIVTTSITTSTLSGAQS